MGRKNQTERPAVSSFVSKSVACGLTECDRERSGVFAFELDRVSPARFFACEIHSTFNMHVQALVQLIVRRPGRAGRSRARMRKLVALGSGPRGGSDRRPSLHMYCRRGKAANAR